MLRHATQLARLYALSLSQSLSLSLAFYFILSFILTLLSLSLPVFVAPRAGRYSSHLPGISKLSCWKKKKERKRERLDYFPSLLPPVPLPPAPPSTTRLYIPLCLPHHTYNQNQKSLSDKGFYPFVLCMRFTLPLR